MPPPPPRPLQRPRCHSLGPPVVIPTSWHPPHPPKGTPPWDLHCASVPHWGSPNAPQTPSGISPPPPHPLVVTPSPLGPPPKSTISPWRPPMGLPAFSPPHPHSLPTLCAPNPHGDPTVLSPRGRSSFWGLPPTPVIKVQFLVLHFGHFLVFLDPKMAPFAPRFNIRPQIFSILAPNSPLRCGSALWGGGVGWGRAVRTDRRAAVGWGCQDPVSHGAHLLSLRVSTRNSFPLDPIR